MAKSHENGSCGGSFVFLICMVFWLIGRIVNSTLMIVPLPYLGSNFIECSNFSAGFDQLATRLSDAILLFIIVVIIFAFITLALMAINIPYKWIRSIILGFYVLSITLLGYHALTNLATVIQLLIDRYNGHFVNPKVECTSGMSFFGSLIAFIFHTFVIMKLPNMFNAIDEDMNQIKKEEESKVIKKKQKADKKNIEAV